MRGLIWVPAALCLLGGGQIVPAFGAMVSPERAEMPFEDQSGPWELGLDLGIMIPTQRNSFSHVIDNQRAYDLLAAESTGDEIAEGWIAPPLPGNSTISATLTNTAELGAHVYYSWTPWFAWGLDGAWGFKRGEIHIDNRGVYQSNNFMVLHYQANLSHLAVPVKIGGWFGRLKPYLIAGPAAYFLQERASISFTDADDPQLKPVGVAMHSRTYAGLTAGPGLECRIGARGIVGFDAQYNKVFSAPYNLDFFLPKLRLAVAF